MYFSRAPIPHPHSAPVAAPMHHLGLYAFDRDFLQRFSALDAGPLELTESLEQLRALEHGYRIRVGEVSMPTLEINTPSDLERAQQLVQDGVLP